MINGLYTAARAMESAERQHELASENLANVQMQGFKRRFVRQSTFDAEMTSALKGSGVQHKDSIEHPKFDVLQYESAHDFAQGHLRQTMRPLDAALNGSGFFVVEGPNGGELYTRNGSFYLNNDRQLVTIDQLIVQGVGGPITIPDNANAEAISISQDGQVFVGRTEIGQLRIEDFTDRSVLEPMGSTLYAAPPNTQSIASTATVWQGHLEQSNVVTINELVGIISSSKQFEAAQKSMSMIMDTMQKRIGVN
ncbi:MAG: flagellar hook-basal body protein [Planctomyces sp.]|nr:flagellar hook-basal body protein [Planctomyces sp.]